MNCPTSRVFTKMIDLLDPIGEVEFWETTRPEEVVLCEDLGIQIKRGMEERMNLRGSLWSEKGERFCLLFLFHVPTMYESDCEACV